MTKFDIDEALVRKLGQLLKDTGLSELEYEKGDERIRISAQGSGHSTMPASPAISTTEPAPVPQADHPPKNALTSPMVGTVYLSPEPGSPAFVRVGDRVSKGQTLLIIEAMKVMNPITAPDNGTVKAIFIHDAQPVEFGEPMMVIE